MRIPRMTRRSDKEETNSTYEKDYDDGLCSSIIHSWYDRTTRDYPR